VIKIGTRGIIGFRLKGQDKLTYNHFDSYPDGLGVNILEEIRKVSLEALKAAAERIILVQNGKEPSKEQIDECKQWADTAISERTLKEWYCLLRNAQGTLRPYIDGNLRYMIDNSDFIKDSLFCEWAYIVNLDTGKLEVWHGFQEAPHPGNRYSEKPDENGYYPCRMIKEYDLNALPGGNEFVEELGAYD